MRYRYDPSAIEVSAMVIRNDDEVLTEDHIEGFKIFDSRRGNTDDAWIAFSRDVDTAQRIVDLLNDDERAEQPEQGPASAAGR
jgi:hypothetical protein